MTPLRITERLEVVLGPAANPVRLVTAIETELSTHFGLEPIKAAEKAERIADAVAKLIDSRSVQADLLGVSAKLIIIGTTSNMVAGACHVLPTDSSQVVVAKRGRLQTDAMLAKLRSLTFGDFERFGKQILHELGAISPQVTPHGGDQGIDFFGSLNLGQLHNAPLPFIRLSHDIRLLFAGQAKHYPNSSIGPNIVRELIGSISLARTKTFSKDGIDIFGDLDMRPFSPVVAMLFTTGDVTAGAYHLAASAGIVVKNGLQLANFLADRGVGMRDVAGDLLFDELLFEKWLNS